MASVLVVEESLRHRPGVPAAHGCMMFQRNEIIPGTHQNRGYDNGDRRPRTGLAWAGLALVPHLAPTLATTSETASITAWGWSI